MQYAEMLASFAAADAAVVKYDSYVFEFASNGFTSEKADAYAAAAVEALQEAVAAAYRAPDNHYYSDLLAEFSNIVS